MVKKLRSFIIITFILFISVFSLGKDVSFAESGNETVIYSDSNSEISFSGISIYNYGGGYQINVRIKNTANRDIVLQVEDMTVNGISTKAICSIDIPYGETKDGNILVSNEESRKAPLNKVETISIKFRIFDWKDFNFKVKTDFVKIIISKDEIIPSKIFKGCKNTPIGISVSGKSLNDFTFECADACEVNSERTGESSITVGSNVTSSISYGISFDRAGNHKVYAIDGSGEIVDCIQFDIAENHKYSEGEVTKKETCEEDGEKTFECINCKTTYKEVIQRTGHDFGDWEISEEPTALEEGQEERKCDNCGRIETKSIKKLKPYISISKKNVNIKKNAKYTLSILKTAKGDYANLWRISKKNIVKIIKKGDKKCIIKAKKKGTVKITVIMESGISESWTITVK